MDITRSDIESLLKIRIRDVKFYREALTHKSALKEYNVPRSNERLEFIGDAVLNLIITKYLYIKYENENEGDLTKYRMRIVSGKTLSMLSRKIGLQNYIKMNTKAMKQHWNYNDRILEDALEAIIGAIYCDMGYYSTELFVLELINEFVSSEKFYRDENYKDILMRYTQTTYNNLPVYEITNMTGPDHKKIFNVKVIVNGEYMGEGTAKTKKQAEQDAAKQSVMNLNIV
jgi:ribonuclease-3